MVWYDYTRGESRVTGESLAVERLASCPQSVGSSGKTQRQSDIRKVLTKIVIDVAVTQ